jgi:hypothetical protein
MAPDVKLHVDHVTPVALGGTDDPTNLVTACAECNGGKAATPIDAEMVADIAEDATRWAAAMQAAAEIHARAEREAEDARAETYFAFSDTWSAYTCGGKPVPLPNAWKESVARFIEAGLPVDMLISAVHTAMGKSGIDVEDRFRYMCGIAWRKVTALQETAKELLARQGD